MEYVGHNYNFFPFPFSSTTIVGGLVEVQPHSAGRIVSDSIQNILVWTMI